MLLDCSMGQLDPKNPLKNGCTPRKSAERGISISASIRSVPSSVGASPTKSMNEFLLTS